VVDTEEIPVALCTARYEDDAAGARVEIAACIQPNLERKSPSRFPLRCAAGCRWGSTVDTRHVAGYGGWSFGALNLRAVV
jgi:hypothetical protein